MKSGVIARKSVLTRKGVLIIDEGGTSTEIKPVRVIGRQPRSPVLNKKMRLFYLSMYLSMSDDSASAMTA